MFRSAYVILSTRAKCSKAEQSVKPKEHKVTKLEVFYSHGKRCTKEGGLQFHLSLKCLFVFCVCD